MSLLVKGATSLSGLNIDTDKDWLTHVIKDLGAPVANGDALVKGTRLTAAEMLDGTLGQVLTGQGAGVSPSYASAGISTQSVVTGSRSFGTPYQNTTGKPMLVTVTAKAVSLAVLATNTSTNPSGTSHTVNLPAGIVAGNMLVVIIGDGGGKTFTFPAGWTRFLNDSSGGNAAAYRVADGTEGATITVTSSAAVTSSAISFRIEGSNGVPNTGATATGSSANPDPPAVSPTQGTDVQSLIIAMANNASQVFTAYPSGYSGGLTIGTAPHIAAAYRKLVTDSEDPGTFTIAASAGWSTNTLAIPAGPLPLKAYTDSAASPTTQVAQSGAVFLGSVAVSFWVLPGNYYRVDVLGNPSLTFWTEWY